MMKEYDVLHTQWIIFSPVDYIFLRRIKKMNKRIVITIMIYCHLIKNFTTIIFIRKYMN